MLFLVSLGQGETGERETEGGGGRRGWSFEPESNGDCSVCHTWQPRGAGSRLGGDAIHHGVIPEVHCRELRSTLAGGMILLVFQIA